MLCIVAKWKWSPLLFNIYVDDSSVSPGNEKIGCSVGKYIINHILYADDLVLLSASLKGLQKLVNICGKLGDELDILFNEKKDKMYGI